MHCSLLGLDYILRLLGTNDRVEDGINDRFFHSGLLFDKPYINNEMAKSSVGEHYISQMKMFVDACNRLPDRINSFLGGIAKGDLVNLSDSIIQKFVPLGLMTPVAVDMEFGKFYTGADTELLDYLKEPLREVQGFYKDYFGGEYDKYLESDSAKYFKKQHEILERIGVSLCTGYTPQTPKSIVTRISNDTDCFNEALLAYILYPWVTQPFAQLKMLMSTLPRELSENIRSAYFDDCPAGAIPGVATGLIGNTFTFEILADYRVYLECLMLRRKMPMDAGLVIMRQAWTPWFGFDFPSALEGIDDETMGLMNDLMKKSSKLFIDILHTGLQWDAQYGVLAGYRGRFIVSGTFNGMLALGNELKKETKSKLCNAVGDLLQEKIEAILPL